MFSSDHDYERSKHTTLSKSGTNLSVLNDQELNSINKQVAQDYQDQQELQEQQENQEHQKHQAYQTRSLQQNSQSLPNVYNQNKSTLISSKSSPNIRDHQQRKKNERKIRSLEDEILLMALNSPKLSKKSSQVLNSNKINNSEVSDKVTPPLVSSSSKTSKAYTEDNDTDLQAKSTVLTPVEKNTETVLAKSQLGLLGLTDAIAQASFPVPCLSDFSIGQDIDAKNTLNFDKRKLSLAQGGTPFNPVNQKQDTQESDLQQDHEVKREYLQATGEVHFHLNKTLHDEASAFKQNVDTPLDAREKLGAGVAFDKNQHPALSKQDNAQKFYDLESEEHSLDHHLAQANVLHFMQVEHFADKQNPIISSGSGEVLADSEQWKLKNYEAAYHLVATISLDEQNQEIEQPKSEREAYAEYLAYKEELALAQAQSDLELQQAKDLAVQQEQALIQDNSKAIQSYENLLANLNSSSLENFNRQEEESKVETALSERNMKEDAFIASSKKEQNLEQSLVNSLEQASESNSVYLSKDKDVTNEFATISNFEETSCSSLESKSSLVSATSDMPLDSLSETSSASINTTETLESFNDSKPDSSKEQEQTNALHCSTYRGGHLHCFFMFDNASDRYLLDHGCCVLLGIEYTGEWINASELEAYFTLMDDELYFATLFTRDYGDFIVCTVRINQGEYDGSLMYMRASVVQRDSTGIALMVAGYISQIQANLIEYMSHMRNQSSSFDIDVLTGELHFGPAYYELLGFKSNDELPKNIIDFTREYIHQDDILDYRHSMHLVETADSGDYFEVIYRMKHNGGYYIWCIDRGLVVERQANGVASRLIGTTANIDVVRSNFERLKRSIYLDPLTNLHNRLYLNTRYKFFTLEESQPLSLVYVDISGLKVINDFLGHAKGDELVKLAAKVLQEDIYLDHEVIRLSGDEFLLIFNNCSSMQCMVEINKFSVNLNSRNLNHEFSLPLYMGFGIATLNEIDDGDTFIRCEARADVRLQEYKKINHDRIYKALRAFIEGALGHSIDLTDNRRLDYIEQKPQEEQPQDGSEQVLKAQDQKTKTIDIASLSIGKGDLDKNSMSLLPDFNKQQLKEQAKQAGIDLQDQEIESEDHTKLYDVYSFIDYNEALIQSQTIKPNNELILEAEHEAEEEFIYVNNSLAVTLDEDNAKLEQNEQQAQIRQRRELAQARLKAQQQHYNSEQQDKIETTSKADGLLSINNELINPEYFDLKMLNNLYSIEVKLIYQANFFDYPALNEEQIKILYLANQKLAEQGKSCNAFDIKLEHLAYMQVAGKLIFNPEKFPKDFAKVRKTEAYGQPLPKVSLTGDGYASLLVYDYQFDSALD